METTFTPAETLTEMRKARGLTLEEVGRLLGAALGRDPYSHARIQQIEQDGTKDTEQMEALAHIYERPFNSIYEAAKKLRR